MTKIEIMNKFYDAFSKADWKTMNSLYATDVVFEDNAFGELDHKKVTSMWQMLLENKESMDFSFQIIKVDGVDCVNWVTKYEFGPKRNKVTNSVIAKMEIENDKIIYHKDEFDFKVWAKQAIGFAGKLFGGKKWFQRKIQQAANQKLDQFMGK
ncbi:nuclear transport factor 2 family protein [Spiroplasma chinense]|uniref:Nuclear transport factor 2 family protein n=1 Tax=Spiroplasma chinense TaxID=216932 RepID=A0A5B9Y4Z2_9MOLU|nr:nuclear transport factor 2 family protein [Spiroplasma chinense]QEH61853.1 nuclear transport factor 2 family protein [Spiroplasma chinense]